MPNASPEMVYMASTATAVNFHFLFVNVFRIRSLKRYGFPEIRIPKVPITRHRVGNSGFNGVLSAKDSNR